MIPFAPARHLKNRSGWRECAWPSCKTSWMVVYMNQNVLFIFIGLNSFIYLFCNFSVLSFMFLPSFCLLVFCFFLGICIFLLQHLSKISSLFLPFVLNALFVLSFLLNFIHYVLNWILYSFIPICSNSFLFLLFPLSLFY